MNTAMNEMTKKARMARKMVSDSVVQKFEKRRFRYSETVNLAVQMLKQGQSGVFLKAWDNGQKRVKYSGAEDQPRSNGTMVDVVGTQAVSADVVVAPQQDWVNEGHADEQRHNAQCHDLVFAEQPVVADLAPAEAKEDHGEGACGAPPAEEQSGVVLHPGVRLRRRDGVEASRERHYTSK